MSATSPPPIGARPLRRAIQRYVESPLSVQMLKGDFNSGDRVRIDVGDDEIKFIRLEAAPHIENRQEEPVDMA